MKHVRTVGELRANIRRNQRTNRFCAWLFGIESGVGAFGILLTNGEWGWFWFIAGFIFLTFYIVLIVMNNFSLKKLEGLPDDY